MEYYLLCGIIHTLFVVYTCLKWIKPNNPQINNDALNEFIHSNPEIFITILGIITILWPLNIITIIFMIIDQYSDDI